MVIFDWISNLLKLRVTECKTEKSLVVNGEIVMRHTKYQTWYHGINPRVESYNVTVRAKDGKVLRDFDFNSYSEGLIALGYDVETKSKYTEQEVFL